MVETSTDTQKEMGDKITSLRDLVGKSINDLLTFEIKLGDIEQQLKDLATQQEAYQKQTHQRIDELSSSKAKQSSTPLDEGKTVRI